MAGTADNSVLVALISATLSSAAPLILAAMGGVLSERAGVVNIALEGLMLSGAFAAVACGTHSVWLGLLAAVLVGALLGLLHAFLTQKARLDHVVSGLGVNLLALGATTFLSRKYFESGVSVPSLNPNGFLLLALILPFALLFVLKGTKFGLRLRAVGENPESARMAGISPQAPRYIAVTLSGICGALAGASLSLIPGTFTTNMSAGKGYIALAAVIFGKWNPLGAMGGALFFGFFYALQTELQILHLKIQFLGMEWTSPYLLGMLPYLMTIAALVSVVGRAIPPAALGKKGE